MGKMETVDPYSGLMLAIVARLGKLTDSSPRRRIRRICRQLLAPEQLGDRQHQIGGRHPGVQLTGQLQTDDFGDEQRQWLTEQCGLG